MSDLITSQVSDRICKHMNEDHGEAIVLYAKAFGNIPDAKKAEMISIDPEGMDLCVLCDEQTLPIRINFDLILRTLIKLESKWLNKLDKQLTNNCFQKTN